MGYIYLTHRPKIKNLLLTIFTLVTGIWLLGSQASNAQNQPGNQPANTNTTTPPANTGSNNKDTLPKLTEEDIIRANFGMKRSGEGIQFELLNDFENCEDWRASATSPLGETRVRKLEGKPDNKSYDEEKKDLEQYREIAFKKRREAAEKFAKLNNTTPPANTNPAGTNDKELAVIATKYILGVKSYFKDRGFDRVEVAPPNEYIIKGRAKEIRVWALGRKYRHTLFVKVRDYRGKLHTLKMGRMDFFGWKRMTVTIPGWLPQSTRFALLDKNLHFVSFYVVSDQFDSPGTFYFYLDNFSIMTDTAENQYDGSEVLDTW